MARKVFISFLGMTDYYPSCYYRGKKFCSDEEKYVQIPAIKYLHSKENWTENDIIYILLTKAAENRNWVDHGYVDRFNHDNIGLETRLKENNFPCPYEPIKDIPEGRNEEEIWQIFKKIFDVIKDGDELYFDITHGYRYLPMLVLVLGNYAKLLKDDVQVKSILYGNYEGRDKDENGKHKVPAMSPLIELQSLSTLQDWTYAIADFKKNGNADKMQSLAEDELSRKVRKGNDRAQLLLNMVNNTQLFTKDMLTCRGNKIISGDRVKNIKTYLKKIDQLLSRDESKASIDQLLIPVFGEMKKIIDNYDSNTNIDNGFHAAKWCLDHKLYQQAITILQESVKNYFAEELNMDIYNTDDRDSINLFLHKAKYNDIYFLKKEICNYDIDDDLLKFMKMISDDYKELTLLRNDFNHSGMSNTAKSPEYIEKEAKKLYDSISKAFEIK